MKVPYQLRKRVSPLNIFESIDAKSGDKYDSNGILVGYNFCPLIQTFDADSNTYVVDRGTTPTVIVPIANLIPSDHVGNSFDISSPNVTNIKWYVQKGNETAGTDITSHADWANLFTISSDATSRGTITLKKNIPYGDTWKIWMEYDFDDERTGYTQVIHRKTESKTLMTTVNSESSYVMSISRPNGEVYNPLLDKRIEYDYKAAYGLLAEGETFTDDERTYLRKVVVSLKKGYNTLNVGTDYSIKVERYENGTYTTVTAADDDIESINGNDIVFNLSYFNSTSWRISCLKGERVLGSEYYGFTRSTNEPSVEYVASDTINDNSKVERIKVLLSYYGSTIQYPEAYCDISWTRVDTSGNTVQCGGGDDITLDLTDPNVINSSSTGIKVEATVTVRKALRKLTNAAGVILTDENNNVLTIN